MPSGLQMVQNFWTVEGEHKHVNDRHLSLLPLLVLLFARFWSGRLVNIWRRPDKRHKLRHKWKYRNSLLEKRLLRCRSFFKSSCFIFLVPLSTRRDERGKGLVGGVGEEEQPPPHDNFLCPLPPSFSAVSLNILWPQSSTL